MSYADIFIIGWNLNAMMFVVNLILAVNVVKSNDAAQVSKEHEVLSELKEELDNYYPNKGFETLISYFVPFMAFYRVSWRLFEMKMFFDKNDGTRMYDFMVYKYQRDIQIAKNKTQR
jgi:hypothetical protein